MVDKLARYTGLDETWLDEANLRVEIQQFCKELLRAREAHGGPARQPLQGHRRGRGERPSPSSIPSMAAIRPPYTATFNDYVRRELGYKTDLHYYILGGGISTPWDFGARRRLRRHQRGAAQRVLQEPRHAAVRGLGLLRPGHAVLRHRVHPVATWASTPRSARASCTHEYEAGHMMYIQIEELAKLKKDVAEFIQSSLGRRSSPSGQAAARKAAARSAAGRTPASR